MTRDLTGRVLGRGLPILALICLCSDAATCGEHRFLVTDSAGKPLAGAPIIVTTFQERYVPGSFRVTASTGRNGQAVVVLDAKQEAAASIDFYTFHDGYRYSKRSIGAEARRGAVVEHRVRLEACEPELVARVLNPDGTPAGDAVAVTWSEFAGVFGNGRQEEIQPPDLLVQLANLEPVPADTRGVISIQHANHFIWSVWEDGSGTCRWTEPDRIVCSPIGAALLPGGVSQPIVQLRPWASMRGRVFIQEIPAEFNPSYTLDDCQVSLRTINIFPDEGGLTPRQLQVVYYAEVDSEGRFFFPQILPGYGTLELRDKGHSVAECGVRFEGDTAFNWDMSDRMLPDDLEVRVRTTFAKLPENKAVVRVVDIDGRPVAKAIVHCISPLEPGPTRNMPFWYLDCPPLPYSQYPHQETDERGEAQFQFKGTALAVWAVYSSKGYQYRPGSMLDALDVTKLDGPILVTVQRPRTIGGVVVDEQGRPVPKTAVRLHFNTPGSDELVSKFDDCVGTGADGRWRFDRLPENATVRRIEFANYYPSIEELESAYQEAKARYEAYQQRPSAEQKSSLYGPPTRPEPVTSEQMVLSKRCNELAPIVVLAPSAHELQRQSLRTVLPAAATLKLNCAYPTLPPTSPRNSSGDVRPAIAVWSGDGASPEERTLREDKGYARDRQVVPRSDGSCVIGKLPPGKADMFIRMPPNTVSPGLAEIVHRQITLVPGVEHSVELGVPSGEVYGLVRIVDGATGEPVRDAVVCSKAALPCAVPEKHWAWDCWHGRSSCDGVAQVKSPGELETVYRVTHPRYRVVEFRYERKDAGRLVSLGGDPAK